MSREVSSFRIRRLKALLLFLRSRGERGAEVEEILSRCEYSSRRLLQDDIRMLREEFGAEIAFLRSPPRRYRLTYEGDFLLLLSLTERDVVALVAGLGMAGHFLPHMKTSCEALWTKMQKFLPDASVSFGQWLAGAATVATPVSDMDGGVFERLLLSLRDRSMIELDYVSPYGTREVRTHTLAPWGVFFRSHAWYLLAGKEGREAPSVFRLSRVRALRALPRLPFIAPPAGFSQERFTASAWYVAPGELEHDIRLHIVEPMATIVAETRWHPTQTIERLDKDTVILSACVPDIREAARWVLSAAPYIAVLSPPELRGMVHDLAAEMMEKNAPNPNPTEEDAPDAPSSPRPEKTNGAVSG